MTHSKQEIILAARVLAHEDSVSVESRLAEIAQANHFPVPYAVVRSKLDPGKIGKGSVIIIDSIARLGDSVQRILRVLAELLAKDCKVISGEDPTAELHDLAKHRTLILMLDHLPKVIRASKIRASLAVRRQNNLRLGREPLSEEVQREIVRLFLEIRTIRGVAARMSGRASRSSVLRTLRARGIKS